MEPPPIEFQSVFNHGSNAHPIDYVTLRLATLCLYLRTSFPFLDAIDNVHPFKKGFQKKK
jgi:hypothetical protein